MRKMSKKTEPEYLTPQMRVVPRRTVPILCDSYRVVDLREEDAEFDWES